MKIDRKFFVEQGKIGGKKSLARFKGLTEKEISEVMRKVRKAPSKKWLQEAGEVSKIMDSL